MLLDTFDRINRGLAAAPALRWFVEQERDALRILTSSAGIVHSRMVARVTGLIEEEVRAGRYEPPVEPATLGFAIVRLAEAFLYNDADGLRGDVDRSTFPTCEFQGPALVHPTATLDNTIVRGPAVIGPGATLSHAYVGPYTSIGAGVRIEGSEIEHSIVLDEAEILHVGMRLDSSVIGRGARIRRAIVDRYNTIDAGDRLGYDLERDRRRHHVSKSGIVVVAKAPFRADTRRHW